MSEFYINVQDLKEGFCILCQTPCFAKSVMHESCALFYDDIKKGKNLEMIQKFKLEVINDYRKLVKKYSKDMSIKNLNLTYFDLIERELISKHLGGTPFP